MVSEKEIVFSLNKLYSIPGKIFQGMVFQELVSMVMDLLYDDGVLLSEDPDQLLYKIESYLHKNDGAWLFCKLRSYPFNGSN
jgi:hypothetical protein